MTTVTAPIPRQSILNIAPYVGGESAGTIRLASNEGALGPSPKALAAYTAVAPDLHRYPDGGAHALRAALGRRWELDPARIVCGTGSDDLLNLLCRAYAGPGDEVIYSRHGFLWYPICAEAAGATPVVAPERDLRTDVDAILAAVTPRTRVVFIANPNNPTGSYITKAELDRLCDGLPARVLLVVDMAYAEFASAADYPVVTDLVNQRANVVMTRTFSKIFALAALRLGWAYCPEAVADVLNRIRGPFNVPAPASAAGVAALEDVDFLVKSQSHNETWRTWFVGAVEALGLVVHPSVANFVLIDFRGQAPGHDNAEAARTLLKARGILVRQMQAYGLPDCLRITIGREDEMRAVVDGLKTYLGVQAR